MKLDKSVFTLHRCIRERYLQYLEGFTLEQLAVIPQGFRNNLLWNISHAIVTQQLYCYHNSGLPMYVPQDFIAAYRKGTVPDGHIPTQAEVDTLKGQGSTILLAVWKMPFISIIPMRECT